MNEETIFAKACKIPAGPRRDAYLMQACDGDPERITRVSALIAEHEEPDEIFDNLTKDFQDQVSDSGPPQKIDEYIIIRELGRGGMGVVYEAEQTSLKRRVALKVLSSRLGLTAKAVLRFRREAEAAAKLHHTNIVPIYATGEEHGVHFYAMELIDGPALDHVIEHLKHVGSGSKKSNSKQSKHDQAPDALPEWVTEKLAYETPKGSLASGSGGTTLDQSSGSNVASGARYFDNLATMMADAADALQHAHDHGVIHRDIKPSNLLLGPDGRLSINDFGLARVLEQPGLTMSGEFVGTPRYMSPEQITAGRAPLDHRTDIYSLGATMYELLTLQPAFDGRSRDEVIGQIMYKDPKAPRKLNRKIPTDLETICLAAMTRDPDQRYQTAGQMTSDLRAYINRHAISKRRLGPIRKTTRWAKRNPGWATLIFVLVMSALAVMAYSESNRRSKLLEAKRLALFYSWSGEFEQAENQIKIAESNRVQDNWVKFAEGQVAVFEGDYHRGAELLRTARKQGAEPIPVRALLCIANLFGGNEMEQLKELRYLKKSLDEGDLVPIDEEDYLYLGLAHMFAEPLEALEYLDQAGTPNRVQLLIRSIAYCCAARDTTNRDMAVEFAENAVRDANEFDESPFELVRYISAQTAAAEAYSRKGEVGPRQRAIERVTDKLSRFPMKHRNGELNSAIHSFMVETGQGADDFLIALEDDQLVGYLRTHRLIRQIYIGRLEHAEKDFLAFDEDGSFGDTDRRSKMALWTLIQLANLKPDDDIASIRSVFASSLDEFLTNTDSIAHIEMFWAVCRILDMPDEAQKCVEKMKMMLVDFKGTYAEQLIQPVVDVAKPLAKEKVLSSSSQSRRRLSFALFALGVEALANGRKEEAIECFELCAEEGYYIFYVTHTSRALLEKLQDGWWPSWIKREDVGNE